MFTLTHESIFLYVIGWLSKLILAGVSSLSLCSLLDT